MVGLDLNKIEVGGLGYAATGSFSAGYNFTPQWGMGKQQVPNTELFQNYNQYQNNSPKSYDGMVAGNNKRGVYSDATEPITSGGKTDPYQFSDNKRIYSLNEFATSNANVSYSDLITQRPWRDGFPGGPQMRYVRNPIDNRVMDMRHVMVVGFLGGNAPGLLVEGVQWLGPYIGKPSTRGSAFNLQDFYSNNIGAGFFTNYMLGGFQGNMAPSFQNYLNSNK